MTCLDIERSMASDSLMVALILCTLESTTDPKSSPRGSEDGGSFSPGTRVVFAQLPRVSYNLPGVNIPLSNARPPIHRMKFPFRRHHRHNLIIIDSHYWILDAV